MTIANVTVIQQMIGTLVIVVVVILALFRAVGQVRTVLTVLLAVLALLHYFLLLAISGDVDIRLLPFFIIESKYVPTVSSVESSLYPDIGQISLASIAFLWRRELRSLMTRWLKCGCSDSAVQSG